jgi:invasion protein IalB
MRLSSSLRSLRAITPIRLSVAAAALACLACAPAAATTGDPQLLAESGAWQTYKAATSGRTSCYILSAPTARRPDGLKRGPAYLFVSRNPRDEIALELGFPLDTDARSTLTVGSQEFELGEQNGQAWLLDADEQRRAVTALKQGANATVETTSVRQNVTEDTYSLEGFTKAYETMMSECR